MFRVLSIAALKANKTKSVATVSADTVCPRQPLMTQVQHIGPRRLRLNT